MSIIVQKFGGSSLSGEAAILRCAARAVQTRSAGHDVVVVVSATGDTTDNLARLAGQISNQPDPPAMDLLLAAGEQISTALMTMAIQSLGVEAVGLAGCELGITTDDHHGEARILSADAERYLDHLDEGRIVVAAGFQGMSEAGRLTTLGRGGSDITAVALAASLEVAATGGRCEIYTDVDGVYTADPRIVPNARHLERIDASHMLALASAGANVLHSRAVSLAQRWELPLHIRNSASAGHGGGGTVVEVAARAGESRRPIIVGCALARAGGLAGIEGRVTVVGSWLENSPELALMAFEALARAGIELISATTSGTEICCLVPQQAGQRALRVIHDALGLGEIRADDLSTEPPSVLEFVMPSQASGAHVPVAAGVS